MKDFVEPSKRISTWKGLVRVYENTFRTLSNPSENGPWLFRADSSTVLKSSLDKALESSDRAKDEYPDVERYLIREFKRRFHHFSNWAAPADDHLQWLATMQHYGAPTRLLDWTYSFFVAAFFALNRIEYKSNASGRSMPTKYLFAVRPYPLLDSAVATIRRRCPKKDKGLLNGPHSRDPLKQFDTPRSTRKFGALVLSNLGRFVYPVTPYHLNDRLSAQQGTFMASGDVRISFQDNMNEGYTPDSKFQILPLRFSPEERRTAMSELNRMNINQGTLFPGLQGFAESLRNNWSLLKSDYPVDGNPVFADKDVTP